MTEVITPVEGEKIVTTPTGDALPGGFESTEAMYAALEKAKADLVDNKTRKTSLTTAEAELQKYKDAEATRLDGERTDLEKAQVKITELETQRLADAAAVSKANKNTLYERVLSSRLAGLDENGRKIMRMHYDAAATVSDFTDEETLKSILDPVDELLKGMKNADGTTVIMSGANKTVDKDQKAPGGFFSKFRDMTPQDRLRYAKEQKKG